MDEIFVIAGNIKEYEDFLVTCIREGRYKNKQKVYVYSANKFKGTIDPEGICIGTWKDRPDINDIIDSLIVRCKDKKKYNRAIELKHLVLRSYDHKQWSIDNFGSPNGA